jgi:hypothetical protein
MFRSTQGNTQVYSPFGSYVVEQHAADRLQRYIDDIPRPDLKLGKDHPLSQRNDDDRQDR